MEEMARARFQIQETGKAGALVDLDTAWSEEELKSKLKKLVEGGVAAGEIRVMAELFVVADTDGNIEIPGQIFGRQTWGSFYAGTDYAILVPMRYPASGRPSDENPTFEMKAQLRSRDYPKELNEMLRMLWERENNFGNMPIVVKILPVQHHVDLSGDDPQL